ncbi:hypothetical protein [Streptomyces luteogriseus]|uniref:hypothetical protein n=1 Tax=Streptomyces luteogriseus TaxID=68233 RepID=UPI00381B94B6
MNVPTQASPDLGAGLLPFLPEPVTLVPGSSPSPVWLAPRVGTVGALIAGHVPGRAGGLDLGGFAEVLHRTGVLDSRSITLPGAAVVLPYGVRIIERFSDLVKGRLREAGYAEYDYPFLAPVDVYAPTSELFDVSDRLLYAADRAGLAAGTPRAVLSPTGEATVYTHWARIVRHESDLPIRSLRRARYYRPMPTGSRSGRGVFKAMEAGDVFEAQSCLADRLAAAHEYRALGETLQRIAADYTVPTLWSERPREGNNGAVADTSVGGDVPLPTGATVQVGCLYDQGQRFSRAYRVAVRSHGEQRFTHHVTAAITRRMVLAHLMLGLRSDRSLCLSPRTAPDQVALIAFTPQAQSGADRLSEALTAAGVRVAARSAHPRRDAGLWQAQGVPLLVHVSAPRADGDTHRVVLVRADTRQEWRLHLHDPAEAVTAVRVALDGVERALVAELNAYVRARHVRLSGNATAEDMKEVLAARLVAVAPVAPGPAVFGEVASWRSGEVLGTRTDGVLRRCVVTGAPTEHIAYVSGRI